jgi:hypothetical protein
MWKRTIAPVTAVALLALGVGAAALAANDDGYGGYPIDTTTTPASTTTPSSGGSGPKPKSYKAALSVGAEVPKPTAPAKAAGGFSGTVTGKSGQRMLRWTLTYRNLSGKALAAHLHRGKPGVAGPVIVPLCGPCKTGQNGRVAIKNDVAGVLERGRAYVNVHTAKNQAGEIRGQLKLLND